MSSARLFFALWPDAAVRAAVQSSCQAVMASCGGRAVSPRNYHLTLAFLGSVEPADWAGVRAAAEQVTVPPLTLVLDRVGYFPGSQVLWVGPAQVPAGLLWLVDELWRVLAPLGLRPPAQAFNPHLTLCRKIRQPPAQIAVPAASWQARGFALLRSVTGSAGAEYLVDQCFPAGSSIEP
ncbi:MAG: RNA 2',3'-cyclic phosphodiesterase [Gammaproteobacteria bacterium]